VCRHSSNPRNFIRLCRVQNLSSFPTFSAEKLGGRVGVTTRRRATRARGGVRGKREMKSCSSKFMNKALVRSAPPVQIVDHFLEVLLARF